ncbi:MAG: O-acetyl-ADP-ribose deacetylase [Alphaproteobacteria bacterium]|nr:O-acetyl-ADP-ribose deacetylase [Alphaproteobacteria bacterium]
MRVTVVQGDLTKQDTDAIVNAANPAMLGGGGVDGAIHRAAGRRLLEACREVPTNARGQRCPTGEARLTPGFDLPARHVIHTVGPIWGQHLDADGALASAFRNSLHLAEQHGLRTIAFPAISCGVYGFPIERAASIAARVVAERAWDLDEVRFVLFDERTTEVFRAALQR